MADEPKDTARDFLLEHPDAEANPDSVNTKLLKGWISDLDENNRSGVRQAWLVGRALNTQRAKLPRKKGEVEKWEKKLKRQLGREPRTLQLYRQVATALDDPEIATALRKQHLDDGINMTLRRVRNVRAGRGADEGPDKVELSEEDVGERLIKQAQSLFRRGMKLSDNQRLRFAAVVQEWAEELSDDDDVERLIEKSLSLLRRGMKLPENPRRRFAALVRRWAEELRATAMPHDLRHVRRPSDRALLRGLVPYPGGKRGQVKSLLPRLGHPARNDLIYIEPFIGGGALLLNLLSRGLVDWIWINDLDPFTNAMWNAVIHYPDELKEMFKERGEINREKAAKSVDVMGAGPGRLPLVEMAYHSIVARRTTTAGIGYPNANGNRNLYREATIVGYTDDKGKIHAPRITVKGVLHDIDIAHWLLSRCAIWQGECTRMDAIEIVRRAPSQSFIYLDPPYWEKGEVYEHSFTTEQHAALAAALKQAEVPFVLSYDDCEKIRNLYDVPLDPPVREPIKYKPGNEPPKEVTGRVDVIQSVDGDRHTRAESFLVKYSMNHQKTRFFKPELRIVSRPLWYMTGEALLDNGIQVRTEVTATGGRQTTATVRRPDDEREFSVPVQEIPSLGLKGQWEMISPADDPFLSDSQREYWKGWDPELEDWIDEDGDGEESR